MGMDILLVRPPRRNRWDISLCMPPLGLAYIAAAARQAGHSVRILDAYALRWSWERFAREMASECVDVMGFSMMTPMKDVVLKAMKIYGQSVNQPPLA